MKIMIVVAVTLTALALAAQTLDWSTVKRSDLTVTDGAVGQVGKLLTITTPETRAELKAGAGIHRKVELDFTYLGDTARTTKLADGTIRHQFGIKLRAADGCNVIYAMWHFEPASQIAVSVKNNPAMHASKECSDNGYINKNPTQSSAAPGIKVGSTHTLRAYLNSRDLTVVADGVIVWKGDVGPEALTFDGPVGFRSDNAHLKFKMSVGDRQ